MNVSISTAVERAFSWMGQLLFKRFGVRDWFVLGFCAFLASLASGGGGQFNSTPSEDTSTSANGGQENGAASALSQLGEWLSENIELALIIGASTMLLGLALWTALI